MLLINIFLISGIVGQSTGESVSHVALISSEHCLLVEHEDLEPESAASTTVLYKPLHTPDKPGEIKAQSFSASVPMSFGKVFHGQTQLQAISRQEKESCLPT